MSVQFHLSHLTDFIALNKVELNVVMFCCILGHPWFALTKSVMKQVGRRLRYSHPGFDL